MEVERRAGGRLFHVRCPATANERSPVYTVDAQRVGGTTRCRDVIDDHAATSTPHLVTPVDREPVNADDVVRVLWFIMSFRNNRNRYTITVEVGGEMLDCSRLGQCGGVEDVDRRVP